MNAKTCKHLRKMANSMALEMHLKTKQPIIARELMVLPSHEDRARKQGHMMGITAVNHPQSVRGIYRWLKRNVHYE
jgi:hypothetical protein